MEKEPKIKGNGQTIQKGYVNIEKTNPKKNMKMIETICLTPKRF